MVDRVLKVHESVLGCCADVNLHVAAVLWRHSVPPLATIHILWQFLVLKNGNNHTMYN
jgi:hypothetical protein